MFAYLIWENKQGKEMKTMLQVEKAEKMAVKMNQLGVNTQISYIK